jgi:hypothetical protein
MIESVAVRTCPQVEVSTGSKRVRFDFLENASGSTETWLSPSWGELMTPKDRDQRNRPHHPLPTIPDQLRAELFARSGLIEAWRRIERRALELKRAEDDHSASLACESGSR